MKLCFSPHWKGRTLRIKKIEPGKKVVKTYIPIYTGLIHGYAETAKLSAYQLGLYVTIHAQADFSTGVWMGSAARLLATVPRDNSLQACQRALRHMCELGLLKDFRATGVRGNTAYLINKFKIRSGERSGQTLNADISTLGNIVYECEPPESIATLGDTVDDGSREPSDQELNATESEPSEQPHHDGDAVGDTVPATIATQGDAFSRSKKLRSKKESNKKPLSPQKSSEREVLREWAKNIILKRAPTTIRNQQAFLKTSLDEFFQNLPTEVESYLTEEAKDYVGRAMWDAPDLPIGYLEITNYLDHLREERDLPLHLDDPRIVDRILDSVKQANPDSLLVSEPFGFFPSPKWQTYRHTISSAYPIKGWNQSRTAVSGYTPSSPGLGTFLWSRPAKISRMAEMLNGDPEELPVQ
jgi:hypothetical protein